MKGEGKGSAGVGYVVNMKMGGEEAGVGVFWERIRFLQRVTYV